MWNVIILLVHVVIGDFCYHEEAAIGLLPNRKYVIITQQVDLVFEVKKKKETVIGNYYYLESDGELYSLLVYQNPKTSDFIIFLNNYYVNKVTKRTRGKGLSMVISTKHSCNGKIMRN